MALCYTLAEVFVHKSGSILVIGGGGYESCEAAFLIGSMETEGLVACGMILRIDSRHRKDCV